MKYRRFGRLEWAASALGLGAVRVPGASAGCRGVLGEPDAIRMIRRGIDGGINYIDLGFPWDLSGYQPILRAVSKALSHGYRDKVNIALTIPAISVSSPDDFERLLETQLSWLGLDRVEFCLVGRLTRDNWPKLQAMGILDCLDDAQADGRIGHAGFSFHDHYQVLKSVVEAYDRWLVCGVDYSYMDVSHDPGATGIRYAAERGLAVVATRPFKGGWLTKDPPEEVQTLWDRSSREWSRAEWALRFVLNHPSVSVAVAGARNMEQLVENLRVADAAEAGGLTVSDEIMISKVRDAFRMRQQVPCPSCRPCMPCPAGIDVPRFFEIYNDAAMYCDMETAGVLCAQEQIHPEDCDDCGVCESRCAKRLPIAEWLARGRDFLGV
jgi:uncharacterized protein